MDISVIGVEEWLNTWERDATWDIAQSTVASLSVDELLSLDGCGGETLLSKLRDERLNYGWIEGSPEFKSQVSSLYRHEIDPYNILQTNGCTGANLNAIMAVVRPGDHVIAEWPTYAPLYEIPRSLGAEVEYWELKEELGWRPDISDLERLVRPDTRLICINNASNPTGTVLDPETVRAIAEIAKTFSAPATRAGWVIADREVSDRIRTMRDYTMISAGVANDAAATYVLENRERVLERNRAIVENNAQIAQAWIDSQPRVSWVAPQGVSTSYIRFDIPEPDEDFCLRLLRERGVLLVPGSRFELPCGALEKGLSLLADALAEFDK